MAHKTNAYIGSLLARAYGTLSLLGFDHRRAKAEGYKDGWAKLLASHDDSEFAAFMLMLLSDIPSQKQRRSLLDYIARESGYDGYLDYVEKVNDLEPGSLEESEDE